MDRCITQRVHTLFEEMAGFFLFGVFQFLSQLSLMVWTNDMITWSIADTDGICMVLVLEAASKLNINIICIERHCVQQGPRCQSFNFETRVMPNWESNCLPITQTFIYVIKHGRKYYLKWKKSSLNLAISIITCEKPWVGKIRISAVRNWWNPHISIPKNVLKDQLLLNFADNKSQVVKV